MDTRVQNDESRGDRTPHPSGYIWYVVFVFLYIEKKNCFVMYGFVYMGEKIDRGVLSPTKHIIMS